MVGSCRNSDDEQLLNSLKEYVSKNNLSVISFIFIIFIFLTLEKKKKKEKKMIKKKNIIRSLTYTKKAILSKFQISNSK